MVADRAELGPSWWRPARVCWDYYANGGRDETKLQWHVWKD